MKQNRPVRCGGPKCKGSRWFHRMTRSSLVFAFIGFLALQSSPVLLADDDGEKDNTSESGSKVKSSGGRIVSETKSTPSELIPPSSVADGSALRPTRAEQQPVSAEIKAQLQKFETARDAYLKRQKELAAMLKGASEDQRKAVREQLKTLRDQWLEQSIQFRREVQSRIPDLKTEIPQFETLAKGKLSVDTTKPDRRLK